MTAVEVLSRYSPPEIVAGELDRPELHVAFAGDTYDPLPIHLLPQETLVKHTPIEIKMSRRITPQEGILLITQSESVSDIGKRTIIASAHPGENEGVADLALFETEFGRDSLIVAKNQLSRYPRLARTTIKSLASSQGLETESTDGSYIRSYLKREEEPGRIIHENRGSDDPRGQEIVKDWNWQFPYYGQVDANPLFVTLVGSFSKRYGPGILNEKYINRRGETKTIREATEAATGWISGRMDSNPHGMVEFYQQTPEGISNQAWRDSVEGYHHADGRLADASIGIASISVQVEAYKAFQEVALLFPRDKEEYLARAEHLRKMVLKHWLEDERGGYFALGSERKANGQRELLKIRTSDMGHVIDSDILAGNDPEIVRMRDMLIATLFSEDMMAAGGIRTLGRNEVRFNPRGYHIGSVWPKDNDKIARGLERHGYFPEAHTLHKKNASIWHETGVFPELVEGDDSPNVKLVSRIVDGQRLGPFERPYKFRLEQPGQLVQAWSVDSISRSLEYLEYEEQYGRPPIAA